MLRWTDDVYNQVRSAALRVDEQSKNPSDPPTMADVLRYQLYAELKAAEMALLAATVTVEMLVKEEVR